MKPPLLNSSRIVRVCLLQTFVEKGLIGAEFCPPHLNLYVKTLTPNVTIFEDRAFKR